MSIMSNWKTKLFGDNRYNFYGWIVTGIAICGGSMWELISGIPPIELGHVDVGRVLVSIYLLLLGLFGLSIQNLLRSPGQCDRGGGREEKEDRIYLILSCKHLAPAEVCTNVQNSLRSLRHSRQRMGEIKCLLPRCDGRGGRSQRKRLGLIVSARFSFNLHGPGLDPHPLAHISSSRATADLCFAWDGSIEEGHGAPPESTELRLRKGRSIATVREARGTSVYFRDPDGLAARIDLVQQRRLESADLFLGVNW